LLEFERMEFKHVPRGIGEEVEAKNCLRLARALMILRTN
jgi:hypothetical protein